MGTVRVTAFPYTYNNFYLSFLSFKVDLWHGSCNHFPLQISYFYINISYRYIHTFYIPTFVGNII